MRNKKKRGDERNGFELVGEALDLFRILPLSTIAVYYIGAIPFIVGLLFFWADMSRSAFAKNHCVEAALGMAILFLWMKCSQAVFSSMVRDRITGRESHNLTFKRISRVIFVQTLIQPSGLLVLPVALIVLMPFYAAYSFYENVTNICMRTEEDISLIIKRAWKQALLWAQQANILIWLLCPWLLALAFFTAFGMTRLMLLVMPEVPAGMMIYFLLLALNIIFLIGLPLSPFGCIVAGNIAYLVFIIPYVLEYGFGVETSFSKLGWQCIFNSTFMMTVYGLSFLCIDPIIKVAYALRCFYGDSVQSGEDLMLELEEGGQ